MTRSLSTIVLAATLAATLGAVGGCSDSRRAEELELQRQQLEVLEQTRELERQRLEAARLEAERAREAAEAEARREAEVERLWALAREYSRSAGRQIMNAVGGGQDLVVTPLTWTFDPATRELEIPMEVSFNGAFVRANNYQVAGVLTVQEDGSSPQFSRSRANDRFRELEGDLMVLGMVVGGLYVLDELSRSAR